MAISISSNFDGGNIEVLGNSGSTFDLAIRADKDSDFFQWFYFRVDGAQGQTIPLRIVNCGSSAYPAGWPGYRACVSDDNKEWKRTETSYADGVLTISHSGLGQSTWFAYFAPFDAERHSNLVARIAASKHAHDEILGQTLDGRALDMLTIGNGAYRVWLYARQHPGETMAEWWMEGALQFLVSDDPVAQQLRSKARFYVIPNMNPDGSARGHLRTNAAGVNLNREWDSPSRQRSPEVWHTLEKMNEIGVDFAMDIHGDEAIPYVFMAGFDGVPSVTQRQLEFYDRFVHRLAERTHDFQTRYGYPKAAAGKANLTMSTNQLAERFGAVSMTLEMPFKDHDDAPDPAHGWSPARSSELGRQCLLTLADLIPLT